MNLAKPMKIKEGSVKPVWSQDEWLKEHAGETLDKKDEEKDFGGSGESAKRSLETEEVCLYIKNFNSSCLPKSVM